jgi:F-type H+-transporting ATPase subunit gamma
MANLRDIQKRIKSIKNTQQITKAMKMVAAAKLRRAQEGITEARPYAEKMAEVIASLALRTNTGMHPLLEVREPKNATILVLTSDRGLCGSFNSSILRKTEDFIKSEKDKYEDISIVALSKRANDYFKKRNVNILEYHEGILNDTSYQSALIVSEEVIKLFLEEELDEVYIAYTQFKSAISFTPVLERILPLVPAVAEEKDDIMEYIFEPSAKELLSELLEKHIVTQIQRAMLDSVASEHGARMTAMEAATNNASDMIKKLTLIYNRARQAAITTELVEIVSGAEALKG